eukprot:7878867-Lingulodinium_polyedra.AAC.1
MRVDFDHPTGRRKHVRVADARRLELKTEGGGAAAESMSRRVLSVVATRSLCWRNSISGTKIQLPLPCRML